MSTRPSHSHPLPRERILCGLWDAPSGYTPDLRVLNLGAGVQSTTVLLMALRGAFDVRPDCAIFSDTKWEPRAVYKHLNRLRGICEDHGFPLFIVSAGNIRDKVLAGKSGERFASMPLHVRNRDGEPAMLRRQCTREFKVEPIERKIRELLGLAHGQRCPYVVEQWFGISLDEMQRIRRNRRPWAVNRYPLIEKRMTRAMCLRWLERHGYPIPPKSSCIGCPYHDDDFWRRLKDEEPESWAEAVAFDEAVRTGLRGVEASAAYVHQSLLPLSEVDLTTPADHGQRSLFSFQDECEGMCGV